MQRAKDQIEWRSMTGNLLRVDGTNMMMMESLGSEANSIEVVCYGYVSPASFKYLDCCGLEVKGEQFLDQLTVCEGMN